MPTRNAHKAARLAAIYLLRPAQQSELAHLLALALEHNAAIAPDKINFVAVTYRFQQEHPL